MKKAIPARWTAPGMDALPSLAQVDFAIVKGKDGRFAPRLIELQGFPSLSAFEVLQSDAWNEALGGVDGLPKATWGPYFSGLSRDGFLALLGRTIVGDADPEEVVLLDLDPEKQKTAIDFSATRGLLGVDAVDPRSLVKEGGRLFRVKDGRRVPVKRIYNRIVFDELIKKDLELPFDFRDDLEVKWIPHPNWYWTWSKYSLPLLAHETVPKATYLSELGAVPKDLTERYVLKPLFSFAGGGVNVDPRPEDLLRIPETRARLVVRAGEDRVRPVPPRRGWRRREGRGEDDVLPARRRRGAHARAQPVPPVARQDAGRGLQQGLHVGGVLGGPAARVSASAPRPPARA